MRWILIVLFLTSGRYDAGVDIELFRFYTETGCEKAKQYLGNLYKFKTGNKYRGGMLNISDCFQENKGD